MAISRPLLIALLASIGALVVVTAMRVMGGGEEEPPASPTAAQTASPSTAAPADVQAGPASPRAEAPPDGPAAAKLAKARAKGSDPQSRVLRAIARRKVVVIFFGQNGGADDRATRRAVRAVAMKRDGVAVFAASIDDVSKYARVVGGLGVEQSPSTVVIDRGGRGRLVQGFVDEGSLLQLVADARS